VKLHTLTLRIGVVTPSGLHGRTIDASAVAELALVEHQALGRCYLVHAKGRRPRYYLPAAVESCELPEETEPVERRCAVCGEPLEPDARGQTCSRPCARKLGFRRAGQ
jgi:hypothetical protein